jgi:hypothetical protein
MFCYEDKIFCSASKFLCVNYKCYRFIHPEDERRSAEMNLPIASMNFWDDCELKMANTYSLKEFDVV